MSLCTQSETNSNTSRGIFDPAFLSITTILINYPKTSCKTNTRVKQHPSLSTYNLLEFFKGVIVTFLTILERVLEHVVRHATGSHGHVGHHIESVVAS